MIEIESLKPEDVGRSVKYTSHNEWEYGRISSWNHKFIFVRYYEKRIYSIKQDTIRVIQRSGQTAEATSPGDLEWLEEIKR